VLSFQLHPGHLSDALMREVNQALKATLELP